MRGPDYTLDLDRLRRVGFPEVVLAQGKSAAQIVEICRLLSVGKPMKRVEGSVSIVTAGTSDAPVAEEARRALEYLGVSSTIVPDVGVAGVLRLLSRLEEIEQADVVIAVAGMEASLFSVLGGLVGRPLIAVPTSNGYGASLGGFAALLSAASSCANGVTAVNIDSGYSAAMAAYRILSGGPHRWDRKPDRPPPASTSTPRRSASTGAEKR